MEKNERWKVKLKDGSVFTGKIVSVKKDQIHILTDFGEKAIFSEEDISRAHLIKT